MVVDVSARLIANRGKDYSGRNFMLKNLGKEAIFIQACLPLAMTPYGIQSALTWQGKKSRCFNWPQLVHQCINGAPNHFVFLKISMIFHFKFSLSQNAIGAPTQTGVLSFRHCRIRRSSQVMKSASAASAKAKCAASAGPRPNCNSCSARRRVGFISTATLRPICCSTDFRCSRSGISSIASISTT
jgi:hypothetical protein